MNNNPERTRIINERLVGKPVTAEEYDYYLDLFARWEDRIDAGLETDQGHQNWVHGTRRRIWDGTFTADQVAGMVRTYHVLRLWDQEHVEPRELPEIDWSTGKIIRADED